MKKGNDSILDKASEYAKEHRKATEQADLALFQKVTDLFAPLLPPALRDRANSFLRGDPMNSNTWEEVRGIIELTVRLKLMYLHELEALRVVPLLSKVATDTAMKRINDIREPEVIDDIHNIMKKYAFHWWLYCDDYTSENLRFVLAAHDLNMDGNRYSFWLSSSIRREIGDFTKTIGIDPKRLSQFNKSPWFNRMIDDLIEYFKDKTHDERKCSGEDICTAIHGETFEFVHLIISAYFPDWTPSRDSLKKRYYRK